MSIKIYDKIFDFDECLQKWFLLKKKFTPIQIGQIISEPNTFYYRDVKSNSNSNSNDTYDIWFIKDFAKFFINFNVKAFCILLNS